MIIAQEELLHNISKPQIVVTTGADPASIQMEHLVVRRSGRYYAVLLLMSRRSQPSGFGTSVPFGYLQNLHLLLSPLVLHICYEATLPEQLSLYNMSLDQKLDFWRFFKDPLFSIGIHGKFQKTTYYFFAHCTQNFL